MEAIATSWQGWLQQLLLQWLPRVEGAAIIGPRVRKGHKYSANVDYIWKLYQNNKTEVRKVKIIISVTQGLMPGEHSKLKIEAAVNTRIASENHKNPYMPLKSFQSECLQPGRVLANNY